MKFGKQLDALAIPRFRGYYMQYKELKKTIKVLSGEEKNQSTVLEVTHWTSSFLRLGPSPEMHPEARLQQILGKELDRVSKFVELEEDAIRSQLDKLATDSANGGDRTALKQTMADLGEQIVNLKSFAQLNFSGFRKIVKKYDKSARSHVMPWFMAQVARAPMMTVAYDDLLEKLGRIAALLREKGAEVSDTPEGMCALSFFVERKDTMRVKVELTKRFAQAGARSRAVATFLDTPGLAFYSAALSPDQARATPVPSPCATTLVAGGGGGPTLLLDEAPGRPARALAELAAGDVERLLKGNAAQPLPSSAPGAKDALTALQKAVKEQRLIPVAQATYQHSRFVGDGADVALDEDVRMEVPKGGPSSAVRPEFFPFDLLTVCVPMLAEGETMPRWLAEICEGATLLQVFGFSKSAHAVAHFHAKDKNVPLPHWYRSVMNFELDEEGEAKQEDTEQVAVGASESGSGRPSADATKVLTPSPPAPPRESPAPRAPAPAGGLSAPLLEPDTVAETPLSKSPAGREGFSARLARRLVGKAKPLETEGGDDRPVRRAIVSVQPKTIYSNERTFLEWIHFATVFASLGVLMMTNGTDRTVYGETKLGRCLVVVSLFLVVWAARTFSWRAEALDNKEIRSYEDPIGPPLLIVGLLLALVFSAKNALAASEAAAAAGFG